MWGSSSCLITNIRNLSPILKITISLTFIAIDHWIISVRPLQCYPHYQADPEFIITTNHNIALKILEVPENREGTAQLCTVALKAFWKPPLTYHTDPATLCCCTLYFCPNGRLWSSKCFLLVLTQGLCTCFSVCWTLSLLLCTPCQLTHVYTGFRLCSGVFSTKSLSWCPRLGWSSPVPEIQQNFSMSLEVQSSASMIFSFKQFDLP